MNRLDEKIQTHFGDVAINRTLVEKVGLKERVIPSFVVDWLVSRYSNGTSIDIESINKFVERHLPDKNQAEQLKNKLYREGKVRLIDAVKVEVDLGKGRYKGLIPSLGISNAQVEPKVVDEYPALLNGNVWGRVELVYRIDEETSRGEVWMNGFHLMQTGEIDLDYFIEQRSHFTLEEWVDLLLQTIGYNPIPFKFDQKLYMLLRLVPIVEARVNLMELGPKGSGKSYVYSNLSRYVWLLSGGVVTRAQMFYNMKDRREGIIAFFDTVVLDEVQTIRFTDPGEIIGALKGYLESGEFRVMGHRGTSEASFVILANIKIGADGNPSNEVVLLDLPEFLRETAFVDRFHGIIPSWKLDRITKEAITVHGYALRTDYFYEVLHQLRFKSGYGDYVKKRLVGSGDLRDIRAVERISTGLLKLLFPDVITNNELPKEVFEKFCVDYGKELRQLVRKQLALLDSEYKDKIAEVGVK